MTYSLKGFASDKRSFHAFPWSFHHLSGGLNWYYSWRVLCFFLFCCQCRCCILLAWSFCQLSWLITLMWKLLVEIPGKSEKIAIMIWDLTPSIWPLSHIFILKGSSPNINAPKMKSEEGKCNEIEANYANELATAQILIW